MGQNRATAVPYGLGMEMRRHFIDHPAAVGETYFEHLCAASGFVKTLAKATAACAVHAVVPSMCERTASTAIRDLNDRMSVGARGHAIALSDEAPITAS